MAVNGVPRLTSIFWWRTQPAINFTLLHRALNARNTGFTKNFTSYSRLSRVAGGCTNGLQSRTGSYPGLQATYNILLSHQNSALSLLGKKWPAFQIRCLPTLNQIQKQKPRTKRKKPKKKIPDDKKILIGPQRKGVCVKLVVRTPKKPNSAQRKCAILRLSNGKLITAYIPGEKGVLQEHGVVLFEGGRVQDCPGIKYKIIRRKYDMN